MVNATERRAEEKAGKEADAKTRRRAEQAAIVTALRTVLDGDEQLLGFARGRLAGGWRGKLNVGPEAFFAPHVNIGLSERRVILQHIHPEDGKPSEIAPHFFDIADLQALTFTDIETFGAEPAGRIVLEFNSEQRFRMRVKGGDNLADGQALAEVFQSLTTARRKSRTSPTQTVCPSCVHVLDQPSRFCPYCGAAQAPPSPAGETATPDASAPSGAAGFADFRAPSNAGFADASAPPVPGFADASVPPPPPGSNPPPAPGDTIPFAPFAGENPPPPVAPTPPMPFQSASPPAPSAPDNADTPVFTLPSDGGVTQAPAAPAAAPESFDAWVSRVAPRLTVTPESWKPVQPATNAQQDRMSERPMKREKLRRGSMPSTQGSPRADRKAALSEYRQRLGALEGEPRRADHGCGYQRMPRQFPTAQQSVL